MKISRNTWHYKYWRYTYGDNSRPRNTTLCAYVQRIFWYSLWYAIWYPSLVVMITLGAVGLGYGIFYQGFYKHTYITLSVIAAIAVVFGCAILYENYQYKEPGVFRQWVRAKKKRVCPLVEFTD